MRKENMFGGGRLLDFGCGNKPYECLFQCEEYIGCDIYESGHNSNDKKVDVFYDGHTLPFNSESFDTILITQVLEHVQNFDEIFKELVRVLKKNGIDPQKDTTLDDSIKFDLMAGAFASGNADYVTLFEPTASMTQEQGKGYMVASVGEAARKERSEGIAADDQRQCSQGHHRPLYKGGGRAQSREEARDSLQEGGVGDTEGKGR